MKTKSFIPSLSVKLVHVVVVLSILLTSAFSAAGVKRAAAKASETGSGLTPSEFFNLIIPAYHRQQALQDKVFGFLGIDPGKAPLQEAEPTPGDGGNIQPTPTAGSDLPPTPTLTATDTEAPTSTMTLAPTVTLTSTGTLTYTETLTPSETLTPLVTLEPTLTIPPCPGSSCLTPTPPEATATPVPSETPTESPAPSLPPEASPTLSPSPTQPEKSTATPTATETLSATQVVKGQVGITLTLEITPTQPAPGDILTLTWGTGLERPLDGLELRLMLPEGIDLWGASRWELRPNRAPTAYTGLGGLGQPGFCDLARGKRTLHIQR